MRKQSTPSVRLDPLKPRPLSATSKDSVERPRAGAPRGAVPVSRHGADLQGATEGGEPAHSPFTQTLEGSMVKTSAHDCVRICVKTAIRLAAAGRTPAAAARPHRGHDVFEGVKARQHGEDPLRPVCDLGQLQGHSGFNLPFRCPVAPLGARPPSNEPSRKLVWRYRIKGRSNRFLPRTTSALKPAVGGGPGHSLVTLVTLGPWVLGSRLSRWRSASLPAADRLSDAQKDKQALSHPPVCGQSPSPPRRRPWLRGPAPGQPGNHKHNPRYHGNGWRADGGLRTS